MTKEDKELLLKDLCARLPYGVVCHYNTAIPMIGEVINNGELQKIKHKGESFVVNGADCLYDDIKPYLRSMSSMTEEEKYYLTTRIGFEIDDETHKIGSCIDEDLNMPLFIDIDDIINLIEWLNSHHFDYRGLIEKGLALEAPEGMYKIA